jgi:hypothetical protein
VVQVNDLPLDGLASLQVRVDLLARGDVWLDDLQLCGLAFSNAERVELFKLIAPAEVKLERGEVGDCLRLLDNYWSRFLLTNVPISPAATVRRPEPSRTTASPTPPAPQRSAGLMDRLKSMVPDKLRF